jgi:hypothetical protein
LNVLIRDSKVENCDAIIFPEPLSACTVAEIFREEEEAQESLRTAKTEDYPPRYLTGTKLASPEPSITAPFALNPACVPLHNQYQTREVLLESLGF